MPDLSTINPTLPTDTELVSNGASRMRELRAALLDTFDNEHTLDGKHMFPNGITSVRPAPDAVNGRLYMNDDRQMLERTLGGVWHALHCARPVYQYIPGFVSAPLGSVALSAFLVDSPLAGTLVVFGQWTILIPGVTSGPTRTYASQTHILLDGATILDPGESFFTIEDSSPAATAHTCHAFGIQASGLTEGSHSLSLIHRTLGVTGTSTVTVQNRFLGCILL